MEIRNALRAALVPVGVASLIGTLPLPASAASSRPVQVSARVWRHVVHEPGRLCLTLTARPHVYDVQAVMVSASQNDVVSSRMVRQAGTVFTLCLRFPRGEKTGAWYFAGIYATQVGRRYNPYAGPVIIPDDVIEVRSR